MVKPSLKKPSPSKTSILVGASKLNPHQIEEEGATILKSLHYVMKASHLKEKGLNMEGVTTYRGALSI